MMSFVAGVGGDPGVPLGTMALVKYNDRNDTMYDERVLVGHIKNYVWMILTPGLEMYPEDLAVGGAEQCAKYSFNPGMEPFRLVWESSRPSTASTQCPDRSASENGFAKGSS